jgi:hypothetical protein
MHEYIRETSTWKYDICEGCEYRTSFTCVICKYCWSCHWKKERLERNEPLRNKLLLKGYQKTNVRANSSNKLGTNLSLMKPENIDTTSSRKAMINVFGEEEPDPICNYLNCNHAFSLHKDRNNHCKVAACNCRHPQNSVIGLRQ